MFNPLNITKMPRTAVNGCIMALGSDPNDYDHK